MSPGQYIIAVDAMAIVITTSIGLGRKSILGFGCTTTFAPLLWSTCSSAVHLFSVAGYHIERKKAGRRIPVERVPEEEESSKTAENSEQLTSENNQAMTPSMPQQRSPRSWLSWFRDAWFSETTICANRSEFHHFQNKAAVPRIAVFLTVVAGLLSFLHVTAAIIIFSSLQLVTVWDALTQVLWRYTLSSTLCRLILIMEISELKFDAESGNSGQTTDYAILHSTG